MNRLALSRSVILQDKSFIGEISSVFALYIQLRWEATTHYFEFEVDDDDEHKEVAGARIARCPALFRRGHLL